jgi:hypothetical protein
MPVAGKEYPSSYAELLAWFPDEDACLELGRSEPLVRLRVGS